MNVAAVGRDPLRLPRFAAFARLEPGDGAALVARLVADGHLPVIPCARGEREAGAVGEGVGIRVRAAVVQQAGKAGVRGDLHAGGCLPGSARFLRDPGKAQMGEIVPQRGFQVVGAHGCDFQEELLLCLAQLNFPPADGARKRSAVHGFRSHVRAKGGSKKRPGFCSAYFCLRGWIFRTNSCMIEKNPISAL